MDDPTVSDSLGQVNRGEPLTDQFIYTLSDEHGATDFAKVEVTITGDR